MVKVLFVCMGNICRSPTAEAVFRARVEEAKLMQYFVIDSAGTHDYHVGAPPDSRTQHAAKQRGYDMSQLRGRQVEVADFARFDYILAMDQDNLAILLKNCPAHLQHKVNRLLAFSPRYLDLDVPDPYYGGRDGFETVLDMVEDAAEGLIEAIKRNTK